MNSAVITSSEARATITATNWRPANKGTLRGTSDLILTSGLIVRGVEVHRRKNGAAWIQWPKRVCVNDAGQKQQADLIGFASIEVRARYAAAALGAVMRLLERKGQVPAV